jgi:hypothetical protein
MSQQQPTLTFSSRIKTTTAFAIIFMKAVKGRPIKMFSKFRMLFNDAVSNADVI